MASVAPSVWVTRPSPGNAVTVRALVDAGVSTIAAPVLITRSLAAAALPADDPPDWVVFVSGNAVQGFEDALCRSPSHRLAKPMIRAAAVGWRTAASAAAKGWQLEPVPKDEDSTGLLAVMFSSDLRGRKIWIPSGNRAGSATGALPRGLAERGGIVSVFPVYETVERPLSPEESRRLDEAVPGAIIFHSPSAADAVFASDAPAAAMRWRDEASAVAIGLTTFGRLRELGSARVARCREPSDPAVVMAVAALDTFKPWRSTS